MLAACCAPAIAAGQERPRYLVSQISTADADTVQGDIHLGWGVLLDDEKIRFSSYDAWETSKRRQAVRVTDEEIIKGQRATAELQRQLATGQLYIEDEGRDVYGRILGRPLILREGRWLDLGEIMTAKGHARK